MGVWAGHGAEMLHGCNEIDEFLTAVIGLVDGVWFNTSNFPKTEVGFGKTKAPVQTLENLEMKKTLVALAALASVSAFAQSSVTISGVLDAGYSSFSAKNGTSAEMAQKGLSYSNNDTSRVLIKAVEDIGGGIKAGATIESTLVSNPRTNFGDISTATAAPSAAKFALAGTGQTTQVTKFGDRIMTVDLTVGQHTINIGNQAQPTRSVAVGFQADGSNLIGNLVGNDATLTGRVVAATYVFNAGNGLTAGVSYIQNTKTLEGNKDNKAANGSAFKVEYANGPLAAGYVWSKQTTAASASTTAVGAADFTSQLPSPITALATDPTKSLDTTMSVLGASYDLAPIKVYGQTMSVKNEDTYTTAYTNNNKRKATSVGARYMIGDSYFFAQVSSGKNQITGTDTDYDWKGSGYGYKHALSKRTVAYVGIGKTEFGTTATTTATTKETILGLQHAF
jgi:GBP family porin